MQHPPRSANSRGRGRARFGSVALFALAGALAAGCGQVPSEPSTTTRQSIAGGTADTSHQDVFLLVWHGDQGGGLCTATLIAPNLLLTARHCVSPIANDSDRVLCGDAGLGEPRAPDVFIATNDARPSQSSPFFHGREVRVPESGVDTCGYDIALIILKENVPEAISTPAVPRIDREVIPGESYTAVGYGQLANGQPSGSRMQLAGLSIECEPGSCGDGIESTEFLGEKGICSGDSGGPALDGDGKVLGVVSRGGPGCSEPIYGAVAAWRDFIVSTAAEAATLGGYDAPFWVKSGSSDPPLVSGAAGAGPEPAHGAEGDVCHGGDECGNGLVCYAKPGSAIGACTVTCSTASDCADGATCKPVGGVSICSAPSRDVPSGCSSSKPPRGPLGAASLLVASCALALWRRRSVTAARS